MLSSVALQDGIVYLRAGALDRASLAFQAAIRQSSDPRIRSEALRRQADVKRRRAQWDDALRLLSEAVQIARNHALCDHVADALNIEGTIHLQRGDSARAVRTFTGALAEDPSPRQRGRLCQNLGTACAQAGAHEDAARWYGLSAMAFGAAGQWREQIAALTNRGSIRLDQEDLAAAEEIFRDALRQMIALPHEDAELRALVEINLAEALARQGCRLDEAYDLVLRAIGHFSASADLPHRVACHRVFALVTEAQGHTELALGALERGLELARRIESVPEMAYMQRELARLRSPEHNEFPSAAGCST